MTTRSFQLAELRERPQNLGAREKAGWGDHFGAIPETDCADSENLYQPRR
jgi:hypothetical protein